MGRTCVREGGVYTTIRKKEARHFKTFWRHFANQTKALGRTRGSEWLGNRPARVNYYGNALPINFNLSRELIRVFTFNSQAERCVIPATLRDP
jgi:hypothetical protein